MKIGFTGLLQLLLIGLKLGNVIAWSWLVVLIPTFVSLGLGIVVLGIALWAYK